MAHGKSRFKRPGIGSARQQPQQPQQQINIPLNTLDNLVCGQCGGVLFIQIHAMKFLSALQHPHGKEGTAKAPAGDMCVNCGAINNVIRQAPGEEKANVIGGEEKPAVSGVPGVLQDPETKTE